MTKKRTPTVVDQRGNYAFRGDDSALFAKLCAHLTLEQGKAVIIADVLRDAMRCLAAQKGVKL